MSNGLYYGNVVRYGNEFHAIMITVPFDLSDYTVSCSTSGVEGGLLRFTPNEIIKRGKTILLKETSDAKLGNYLGYYCFTNLTFTKNS